MQVVSNNGSRAVKISAKETSAMDQTVGLFMLLSQLDVLMPDTAEAAVLVSALRDILTGDTAYKSVEVKPIEEQKNE